MIKNSVDLTISNVVLIHKMLVIKIIIHERAFYTARYTYHHKSNKLRPLPDYEFVASNQLLEIVL